MSKGLSDAELVVFESSAHMTYVEENEKYMRAVREFLNRRMAILSATPTKQNRS